MESKMTMENLLQKKSLEKNTTQQNEIGSVKKLIKPVKTLKGLGKKDPSLLKNLKDAMKNAVAKSKGVDKVQFNLSAPRGKYDSKATQSSKQSKIEVLSVENPQLNIQEIFPNLNEKKDTQTISGRKNSSDNKKLPTLPIADAIQKQQIKSDTAEKPSLPVRRGASDVVKLALAKKVENRLANKKLVAAAIKNKSVRTAPVIKTDKISMESVTIEKEKSNSDNSINIQEVKFNVKSPIKNFTVISSPSTSQNLPSTSKNVMPSPLTPSKFDINSLPVIIDDGSTDLNLPPLIIVPPAENFKCDFTTSPMQTSTPMSIKRKISFSSDSTSESKPIPIKDFGIKPLKVTTVIKKQGVISLSDQGIPTPNLHKSPSESHIQRRVNYHKSPNKDDEFNEHFSDHNSTMSDTSIDHGDYTIHVKPSSSRVLVPFEIEGGTKRRILLTKISTNDPELQQNVLKGCKNLIKSTQTPFIQIKNEGNDSDDELYGFTSAEIEASRRIANSTLEYYKRRRSISEDSSCKKVEDMNKNKQEVKVAPKIVAHLKSMLKGDVEKLKKAVAEQRKINSKVKSTRISLSSKDSDFSSCDEGRSKNHQSTSAVNKKDSKSLSKVENLIKSPKRPELHAIETAFLDNPITVDEPSEARNFKKDEEISQPHEKITQKSTDNLKISESVKDLKKPPDLCSPKKGDTLMRSPKNRKSSISDKIQSKPEKSGTDAVSEPTSQSADKTEQDPVKSSLLNIREKLSQSLSSSPNVSTSNPDISSILELLNQDSLLNEFVQFAKGKINKSSSDVSNVPKVDEKDQPPPSNEKSELKSVSDVQEKVTPEVNESESKPETILNEESHMSDNDNFDSHFNETRFSSPEKDLPPSDEESTLRVKNLNEHNAVLIINQQKELKSNIEQDTLNEVFDQIIQKTDTDDPKPSKDDVPITESPLKVVIPHRLQKIAQDEFNDQVKPTKLDDPLPSTSKDSITKSVTDQASKLILPVSATPGTKILKPKKKFAPVLPKSRVNVSSQPQKKSKTNIEVIEKVPALKEDPPQIQHETRKKSIEKIESISNENEKNLKSNQEKMHYESKIKSKSDKIVDSTSEIKNVNEISLLPKIKSPKKPEIETAVTEKFTMKQLKDHDNKNLKDDSETEHSDKEKAKESFIKTRDDKEQKNKSDIESDLKRRKSSLEPKPKDLNELQKDTKSGDDRKQKDKNDSRKEKDDQKRRNSKSGISKEVHSPKKIESSDKRKETTEIHEPSKNSKHDTSSKNISRHRTPSLDKTEERKKKTEDKKIQSKESKDSEVKVSDESRNVPSENVLPSSSKRRASYKSPSREVKSREENKSNEGSSTSKKRKISESKTDVIVDAKSPRKSSSRDEDSKKSTENVKLSSKNSKFSSENSKLSSENSKFTSENSKLSSENSKLSTEISPSNETDDNASKSKRKTSTSHENESILAKSPKKSDDIKSKSHNEDKKKSSSKISDYFKKTEPKQSTSNEIKSNDETPKSSETKKHKLHDEKRHDTGEKLNEAHSKEFHRSEAASKTSDKAEKDKKEETSNTSEEIIETPTVQKKRGRPKKISVTPIPTPEVKSDTECPVEFGLLRRKAASHADQKRRGTDMNTPNVAPDTSTPIKEITKGKRGRKRKISVEEKILDNSDDEQPLSKLTVNPKEPSTKKKKSDTDYTCGLCKQFIERKKWTKHLIQHNGLGWRIELDDPIDLENEKAKLNTMIKFQKDYKISVLKCEKCGDQKKSALGMIGHEMKCGLSKDDLEKAKVNCEHCGTLIMSYCMPIHLKSHCRVLKEKEMVERLERLRGTESKDECTEFNDSGRVKRKAVKKAEALLKEGVSSDHFNPEEYIIVKKPHKVNHRTIKKWEKMMEEVGHITCSFSSNCPFTSKSIKEATHHRETCKLAIYQLCALCDFRSNDRTELLEHVKLNHSHGEERKAFDGDDSDTYEGKSGESDNESDSEEGETESELGTPSEDEGSAVEELENVTNRRKRELKRSQARVSEVKVNPKHQMLRYMTFKELSQFKSAADSLKTFRSENYSIELLFPDLKPGLSTYLNDNSRAFYEPSNKISIKFAMQYPDKYQCDIGKIKPETINYKSLSLYEAEVFNNSQTIFIGGPITSMQWLPFPDNYTGPQVLAITSKKDETFKSFSKFTPEPCSIQFWLFTKPSKKQASKIQEPVTHLYSIAIDKGPVWDMKFCPSGGYAENNRLGLLACTVSSQIHIYALPLKQNLLSDKIKSKIVMKLEPSLILESGFSDTKIFSTKISWSHQKNHSILTAGFSNGFVSIWKLDNNSKLLYSKTTNGIKVTPLFTFAAHQEAITTLNHHATSHADYIYTGSLDRRIKVFRLNDDSQCIEIFHFKTPSRVSCGGWPVNWISFFYGLDCEFSLQRAELKLRNPNELGPLSDYGALFNICSTITDVAINEWTDVIYFVSGAGDIFACFRPNYLLTTGSEKTVERYCLSYTEYVCKPENSNDDHGLVFCDLDHTSKSILIEGRNLNQNTRKEDITRYPYEKATKIAVNPNKMCFNYYAVGYQSGFVRIKQNVINVDK
uniref:CSON007687 protein n=1 Tax=Culicoides sonorensis TaxID=179676 RepID=A0A336JYI7_CULSO